MPNWAKWVMGFLVVAVLYLGILHYQQAKWMREVYSWQQMVNQKVWLNGDGPVVPTPPPPFGF